MTLSTLSTLLIYYRPDNADAIKALSIIKMSYYYIGARGTCGE